MVWLAAARSSVVPSGALFATEALPMVPPAPVRFSTMTVRPIFAPNSPLIERAMMSCTPPAAKGTTMRTVCAFKETENNSRPSRLADFQKESFMAKAYWITCYRSISDPDALAAYAKLAGPAIQAAGGKFLVRGTPAKTYELGMNQRTVVTEWESVAAAVAGHDSPGYKEALRVLGNAADRDIRIVEAA